MIEIIKEPKEQEKKIKIPKNMKQIGKIDSEIRLYMEDAVYQFTHKNLKITEQEMSCYILLGQDEFLKDKLYLFVKDVILIDDIAFSGATPVFSEDVWDEIICKMKIFFPEKKIIGWGTNRKNYDILFQPEMEKVAKRHFPGEHTIIYMTDTLEHNEEIFVLYQKNFKKLKGYHVYNEPSEEFKKYLESVANQNYSEKSRKELENEANRRTIERYETNDYESRNETIAKYREYLRENQKKPFIRLNKAMASVAAITLLLFAGAVVYQVNKTGKTVDTIADEQVKEQVISTISKSATELPIEDIENEEEKNNTKKEKTNEDITKDKEENQTETKENEFLQRGYYIVEKGDKLADICRKVYGTDEYIQAVCEANHIKNSDFICPGDKLVLPKP